MRGRRPDSAALQELKGNPSRRRRKTIDDVVEAGPLPADTPKHLSVAAQRFWARIAPELERINFVRATDKAGLERYCETLADYWQIQLKLRGKERVYWTESLHGKMKRIEPLVLLLQRYEKLLFDYDDRLGLNPQARQRILLGMAGVQTKLPFEPDEHDPAAERPERAVASPVGLLGRAAAGRA